MQIYKKIYGFGLGQHIAESNLAIGHFLYVYPSIP